MNWIEVKKDNKRFAIRVDLIKAFRPVPGGTEIILSYGDFYKVDTTYEELKNILKSISEVER